MWMVLFIVSRNSWKYLFPNRLRLWWDLRRSLGSVWKKIVHRALPLFKMQQIWLRSSLRIRVLKIVWERSLRRLLKIVWENVRHFSILVYLEFYISFSSFKLSLHVLLVELVAFSKELTWDSYVPHFFYLSRTLMPPFHILLGYVFSLSLSLSFWSKGWDS